MAFGAASRLSLNTSSDSDSNTPLGSPFQAHSNEKKEIKELQYFCSQRDTAQFHLADQRSPRREEALRGRRPAVGRLEPLPKGATACPESRDPGHATFPATRTGSGQRPGPPPTVGPAGAALPLPAGCAREHRGARPGSRTAAGERAGTAAARERKTTQPDSAPDRGKGSAAAPGRAGKADPCPREGPVAAAAAGPGPGLRHHRRALRKDRTWRTGRGAGPGTA